MISFNRHLATSQAFSVWLEKASTHPEKVQMNTSKYLHHLAHGISVKSTIRFKPSLFLWCVLWVLLRSRTWAQGSCHCSWSLSSCESCSFGFAISFLVSPNSCFHSLWYIWQCYSLRVPYSLKVVCFSHQDSSGFQGVQAGKPALENDIRLLW
jgi:hypothetical protein